MGKEQRKFERYTVNIPTTVIEEGEKEIKEISTKDISFGGIAINTACSFEIGDQLNLTFSIKDRNLNSTGTIRVKIKKDSFNTYGIAFDSNKLEYTKKIVEVRDSIQSLVVKKQ